MIALNLLIISIIIFILFLLLWLISDGFWHGQSPGKRICGLMVVNLSDNKPCSIGKSIIRNIVFKGLTSTILLICFFITSVFGLFSPAAALLLALVLVSIIMTTFTNNKGQHPGDRIAKTQVIEREDYKPDRYY